MTLEVEHASLSIDGKTILDDVSFAIEPGRLNALIGPNGAGKSTLLRVILGLERSPAHVMFDGTDFHALPRRERARIAALVEQSASTEQQIDVHDVVMLGRIPHQEFWGTTHEDADEAIVQRVLSETGTSAFATRKFATLSGGEQQRVQIARALAQQPRLVLLDEPTNHLDIHAQLAVIGLLRRLAETGITILVTMHDLNLAAGFFDHLIALDRGKLVAQGAPDAVLTPDFLARTYGVEATIVPNPATGRPILAYA